MISWYVAAAWFIAGAIVARHLTWRYKSVKDERVIVGLDRKRGKVTLEFTKLGGRYGFGPEDAAEIGRYLRLQADKLIERKR